MYAVCSIFCTNWFQFVFFFFQTILFADSAHDSANHTLNNHLQTNRRKKERKNNGLGVVFVFVTDTITKIKKTHVDRGYDTFFFSNNSICDRTVSFLCWRDSNYSGSRLVNATTATNLCT